jgi:hypothetical protein
VNSHYESTALTAELQALAHQSNTFQKHLSTAPGRNEFVIHGAVSVLGPVEKSRAYNQNTDATKFERSG